MFYRDTMGTADENVKNTNLSRENTTSKHADFKHLQENYDAITDKQLPDYLHRGDISSVNRFLGYHDAMMATCATFLVLPLRNLKSMVTIEDYAEKKKNHELPHEPIIVEGLAGYLDAMKEEFIMFFLGFLIICTIWESNNVRTIVLKRYDDFLVLLGIFQMFATIMLPFSIALQGHWPEDHVTIVMTTVILIIINILDIIMILYGFGCPRLLNMAIRDWSKKERRRFMLTMCIKPIFEICLVGIAGAFTFLNYKVSWILLGLLILWPVQRKLVFYLRRRKASENKQEKSRFFYYFSKGQISKERVEAFTDAAVAIIACVLILDITVEDFPTIKKVKEEGLTAVLKHMNYEFLSFFGTYMAVSFLWYVNHTVIHLFHTVDSMVLYLQKTFLAFLCLAPISNNMLMEFNHGDRNTQVAVLWASCIFFVASITQVLMLAWGYYRGTKLIHQWAVFNKTCSVNHRQYSYIRWKVATLPFWSLIGILSHFGEGDIPSIITAVCIAGTLITFVVLKFFYMNHLGKVAIFSLQRDATTSPMSASEMEMRREIRDEIADGTVIDEKDIHMSAVNETERDIDEELKRESVEEDNR